MKSIPHRCPDCMKPDACGFHGLLVFEDQKPPRCDHHKPPGKPCHEGPVQMEPSRP